jgi:iron complex transport system permease protein
MKGGSRGTGHAVSAGSLHPPKFRRVSHAAGVVLSALFESVTSFLIFRGNPQATQSVLFWLLGSFGLAGWNQLPIPAVALAAAMVYLMSKARVLNALAMGAEPAASLGVDVLRLRRNLFVVARTIVAPQEMPIGVITAFIGAPTLLVLIRRRPYLYGAKQ